MSWFQTVRGWATKNFGSISGAVLLVMTSIAAILREAVPIVRKLNGVKASWKNEASDFILIRDIVLNMKKGDENSVAIADAVYVENNVNLTLFNTAVFLLRERAPATPTPLLNLAVETAYNVMLIMGK